MKGSKDFLEWLLKRLILLRKKNNGHLIKVLLLCVIHPLIEVYEIS